jgi:hypothetical protein
MSERTLIERPLLQQLKNLEWSVIDQSEGCPSDPTRSLKALLGNDPKEHEGAWHVRINDQRRLTFK